MFNMKITRKTGSIARDATIDVFLDDKLRQKLYKLWNNNKHDIVWQHKISARGGIEIIACNMIVNVDFKELKKVYGVKDAKVLLEIATKYTNF